MNRFAPGRRLRAAAWCSVVASALACAPLARAQELVNLLALAEGALVAVEPASYGGWGPVRLLDDAPGSGWASVAGATGGQVFVFELAEPARLERFEFDADECLDGEGRGARRVRVSVSATAADAGYAGALEATLAARANGQSFGARTPAPARFVRLEILDNHGDAEYVELCGLRGYGARPEPSVLSDVSGTYDSSYSTFHIRQQGAALVGCYEFEGGLLTGSVSGRVMKLTWTENEGNEVGPAVMVFALDGKSFRGHWWSGTDRDQAPAGDWNGTRASAATGSCPHWSGSLGGELESALAARGRARVYGVEFDLDSATLRAESRPVLDEVARTLAAHPDWQVAVEGHTDSTGGAAHNQQLSEARAAAVRDYLAGHGVAAERLTSAGLGATRPVADNATELGRARNRRVEIARR
jgi:outer membrane protein OmpA-like peptidoglycan-associated protein